MQPLHHETDVGAPAYRGGMEHTTSADGTTIAYETVGTGIPVVIIGGAFSRAVDGGEIAAALAAQGFAGVCVDRRGRGESGDTPPYVPEREADDIAAVVAAVGGTAALLGHSSGAILALLAASRGVAATHLFLSEPPFRFGDDDPAEDLPERLQRLVDEGRPDEAVVLFQREAVGLPDAVIEQIRSSPLFAGLVPLAQSVVYDATLSRAHADPGAPLLEVAVPTAVLCGEETFPFLQTAAQRLAQRMASAELVIVPESKNHRPDPTATARVVAERMAQETPNRPAA